MNNSISKFRKWKALCRKQDQVMGSVTGMQVKVKGGGKGGLSEKVEWEQEWGGASHGYVKCPLQREWPCRGPEVGKFVEKLKGCTT